MSFLKKLWGAIEHGAKPLKPYQNPQNG